MNRRATVRFARQMAEIRRTVEEVLFEEDFRPRIRPMPWGTRYNHIAQEGALLALDFLERHPDGKPGVRMSDMYAGLVEWCFDEYCEIVEPGSVFRTLCS